MTSIARDATGATLYLLCVRFTYDRELVPGLVSGLAVD
jgi:hypothetical protein